MLQDKNFKGFLAIVPSKVEEIAETTPVCVLRHVVESSTIQMFLEIELAKLASRLNVANNLSNHQIVFTAETLLEDYPACSLEDFVYVFTQMAKGAYGSTYHQLDTSVIAQCMTKHLEQKAYYQERNNQKPDETPSDIDYTKFKQRLDMERKAITSMKTEALKEERERQMKELEIDEMKRSYSPPTEDYVNEVELKREWGRRYHDLHTGKPLKDWISFEEFKKM